MESSTPRMKLRFGLPQNVARRSRETFAEGRLQPVFRRPGMEDHIRVKRFGVRVDHVQKLRGRSNRKLSDPELLSTDKLMMR